VIQIQWLLAALGLLPQISWQKQSSSSSSSCLKCLVCHIGPPHSLRAAVHAELAVAASAAFSYSAYLSVLHGVLDTSFPVTLFHHALLFHQALLWMVSCSAAVAAAASHQRWIPHGQHQCTMDCWDS
jgi:threonine/homoserine/homoserine lactone efflux protein